MMRNPLPASRVLEVLVGTTSALISLGLLTLVILIAVLSLVKLKDGWVDWFFFAMTGLMTIVGGFFSFISCRLTLTRGTKVGGGLLSPTVWRLLGGVFAVPAILIVGFGIWPQERGQLAPTTLSVVFAWCSIAMPGRYSTRNESAS